MCSSDLSFAGELYVPIVMDYPETTFGGFLETPTEYSDLEVQDMIREQGWIVWPPIRFSYDSVNYALTQPEIGRASCRERV